MQDSAAYNAGAYLSSKPCTGRVLRAIPAQVFHYDTAQKLSFLSGLFESASFDILSTDKLCVRFTVLSEMRTMVDQTSQLLSSIGVETSIETKGIFCSLVFGNGYGFPLRMMRIGGGIRDFRNVVQYAIAHQGGAK